MRVNVTGLAKLFDLSNDKLNLTKINGLNQYFVDDIIANFSSIVVVLGKNGGNSSDIVEMLSNKLENIDINTYISDINELTGSIANQAAAENPDSDIVVIRIHEEQDEEEKDSIIIGYETSKNDSLGMAVGCSCDDDSISIKKGKKLKSGIEIPTDLELEISKSDFKDRIYMITYDTKSVDEVTNVCNLIFDGIIKFGCVDKTARNIRYFDKHETYVSEIKEISQIPNIYKCSEDFFAHNLIKKKSKNL